MFGKNAVPVLISIVVHVALLGAMGLYKLSTSQDPKVVAVETVIADERAQQEFEQDLSTDLQVSENLSVQEGGMVTTNLGASASQPVATSKIQASEAIKDPEITVTTIADISIPGLGEIAVDLGEGEVSGEVGARVEGYGAAMHRLTHEMMRMMRDRPVLAVWLFDASNSLKDDREEIRDNFEKIYQELKLATDEIAKSPTRNPRLQKVEPLETMVCSFGERVNKLLRNPTSDLEEIRKAIDNIEPDESGIEVTFSAISRVIDEYGEMARNSKRRLLIIVVSDESGDDEELLEEVVVKTQRFESPVFFLSREAVFGYPYAHERWTDPEPPNLTHWIRIRRGPETAFPETLQYTGFGRRWDSQSSGFGPYSQVRLSKESGGIFFLLSGEEENLAGVVRRGLERKFDDLAMKEYEPLLLSKREYDLSRSRSDFRNGIWKVITVLNPNQDDQLNIRRHGYPLDKAEFQQEAKVTFDRTLRAMKLVDTGIGLLQDLEKLRDEEREPRWRAAYDLALAQLMAYRVRQFQLLLALDEHAKSDRKPEDPKSNEWYFEHSQKLNEPTEEQIQATKVDLEKIEEQRKLALAKFDEVIRAHPGTPWAQRAMLEKQWGFGFKWEDRYWDPRYYDEAYRRQRLPKF